MKNQGELTELRFQLIATEMGLIVSKPFGDNQPYDFIVDNGNDLLKIQVKSTNTIDSSTRSSRYRINPTKGNRVKEIYGNSIDYMACYIIELDKWYIIPSVYITGKSINLYPHRDDYNGKFDRYLNMWELILSQS